MQTKKQRKVKFYIPQDLIDKSLNHSLIMFPFWGNKLIPSDYNFKLFRKYNFDKEYYEIIENIEESDFVLIPYRYNVLKEKNIDLFWKYVEIAKKAQKPIFIDGTGDIEYKIPVKDIYILRIGGYRSDRGENEIQMAPCADDLLERNFNGSLNIREKKDNLPIIGFAGWAYLSFYQRIRTTVKELPMRFVCLFNAKYRARIKGTFFRIKVLKLLEKSELIKVNFIKRRTYSGNVKTAEDDIEKIRRDFVENLLNSDYGLAVRGDANASVRLYEIMSMGRIPLILDTDMVLPLDNIVDYRSFSVFVDFKDLKQIDKILSKFHSSLDNKEFKAMQVRARGAFENYLRVDKFTPYLMKRLLDISGTYRNIKQS